MAKKYFSENNAKALVGEVKTLVNDAKTDIKAYADTQIANLVNSAPETMDTLKEVADAITENKNVVTALNSAIGNKANVSDLTSHTNNTTAHVTSTDKTNWNTAKTHADSAHAPSTAEKNVIVGVQKNGTDLTVNSSTRKVNITVPTKTSELTNDSGFKTTDTVTTVTTTGNGNAITSLSATNGAITATKDSTFLTAHPTITKSSDTTSTATATHGGTITMVDSVTRDGNGHVTKVNTKTVTLPSDADTKYTHPTTSGNKHIPSGGSSGQILRWSADGTAVWGADNNTTYSNFVKSGSGAKAGLVPAPSTTAGTTKYLREDGTWTTPPDTNTTYSTATQSAQGLMSASDKTKLDGIATGANAYTLPTASSNTLGGVKTTSTVTSNSGYTACPIISGVPYYKDSNTDTKVTNTLNKNTKAYITGTTSANTNTGTQVFDTGVYLGTGTGQLTLEGSSSTNYTTGSSVLDVKIPSYTNALYGANIVPYKNDNSNYLTGLNINCGTSTGPGMRGINVTCSANNYQSTVNIDRSGTNSYALQIPNGKSYIATIYSNSSTITTSDREKKTDIQDISEKYEELFFKLQPRLFKYKDGTSGRIHIGAVAQEVEEALNEVGILDTEFAGFVRQEKDYVVDEETGEVTQEEGYDYYLRYEEFVMLLCHMLQKLYTEKNEYTHKLEQRLDELENKITNLEKKLM